MAFSPNKKANKNTVSYEFTDISVEMSKINNEKTDEVKEPEKAEPEKTKQADDKDSKDLILPVEEKELNTEHLEYTKKPVEDAEPKKNQKKKKEKEKKTCSISISLPQNVIERLNYCAKYSPRGTSVSHYIAELINDDYEQNAVVYKKIEKMFER